MSLQEVEQAAGVLGAARQTLKGACIRAVDAGIPQAAVARAGGVHRNTIRSWVAGSDNTLTQVEQSIAERQQGR